MKIKIFCNVTLWSRGYQFMKKERVEISCYSHNFKIHIICIWLKDSKYDCWVRKFRCFTKRGKKFRKTPNFYDPPETRPIKWQAHIWQNIHKYLDMCIKKNRRYDDKALAFFKPQLLQGIYHRRWNCELWTHGLNFQKIKSTKRAVSEDSWRFEPDKPIGSNKFKCVIRRKSASWF